MTVPDLAALREALVALSHAEHVGADVYRVTGFAKKRIEEGIHDALSLVDRLQAENERMREYVDANEAYELSLSREDKERFEMARAALAGSPAANEEQHGDPQLGYVAHTSQGGAVDVTYGPPTDGHSIVECQCAACSAARSARSKP